GLRFTVYADFRWTVREISEPSGQDSRPVRLSLDVLRGYLAAVPRHGSTTDVVTDALREAILDGALPPSTWLREGELAEELSVSRTPVREAPRRLSDEGLTLRNAHRGSLVAPMTLDDILAVYAVREVLEGMATAWATRRRPSGLVETLSQVHREMTEHASDDDPSVLMKLELRLHRTLREACGNPYLERFLAQIEHAVRRFGRSNLLVPGRIPEMVGEHRAILEAVASGDADLAHDKAVAHMRRARDVRIKAM